MSFLVDIPYEIGFWITPIVVRREFPSYRGRLHDVGADMMVYQFLEEEDAMVFKLRYG